MGRGEEEEGRVRGGGWGVGRREGLGVGGWGGREGLGWCPVQII